MAKSLNNDASTFIRPGPYSTLRAALPKLPLGGCANAVASNQRCSERWSEGNTPLPVRSGRLPPALLVLAELFSPRLKGRPLCAITLAFTRQPPSRVCVRPFPAKTGSSYVPAIVKRWRISKLELPRSQGRRQRMSCGVPEPPPKSLATVSRLCDQV